MAVSLSIAPATARQGPKSVAAVPFRPGLAAGVSPLTVPFLIPTGWAFEVVDPWGNVIGFTDYLERPDLGRATQG